MGGTPWERNWQTPEVVSEGGSAPWERSWAQPESEYAHNPRIQEIIGRTFTPDQEELIQAYHQQSVHAQKVGNATKDSVRATPVGKDPYLDRANAIMAAEQSGWTPPEGFKKLGRGTSAAAGWSQGSSLYLADEVSGLIGGVGSMLRGDGFEEGYRERADGVRLASDIARLDNPVSYGAGEIGGGLSTAVVPVGTLANTASRTNRVKAAAQASAPGRVALELVKDGGKTVGTGLVSGAAWGGAAGFGMGDGNLEQRLASAKDFATIGALFGGATAPAIRYVAAPLIKGTKNKFFTSAENKALDAIIKRSERSGRSLDDIKADFDRWAAQGDVPETLAEMMGPHERELLSAMVTSHRATREAAEQTLLSRGRDEVERLEDAFGAVTGKSGKDLRKVQAEIKTARSEDPAIPYARAHYGDGDALVLLPDDAQKALDSLYQKSRTAKKSLQRASDDLDAAGHYEARDQLDHYIAALSGGKPPPKLSVQAADYAERVLSDDLMSIHKGNKSDLGTARGLKSLQDQIRAVIDGPTGLGEARAIAAERIRRGELLEEGRKFMEKGTDVEDIQDVMRGNPELGVPAASEAGQNAYLAGATRQVSDELRNVPDMLGFADAARKVARTPALRAKIDAIKPKKLTKKGAEDLRFKQTRQNAALDEAIERVSDRSTFTNELIGNSRTAFRQSDVASAQLDDTFGAHMGDALQDLITSGPIGAVSGGMKKFGAKARDYVARPSVFNPRFNEAAREVLLATGDDIPTQIAKLLTRQQKTGRGVNPGANGSAQIAAALAKPQKPAASGVNINAADRPGLAGGAVGALAAQDLDGDGEVSPMERLIFALGGGATAKGGQRAARLRGSGNLPPNTKRSSGGNRQTYTHTTPSGDEVKTKFRKSRYGDIEVTMQRNGEIKTGSRASQKAIAESFDAMYRSIQDHAYRHRGASYYYSGNGAKNRAAYYARKLKKTGVPKGYTGVIIDGGKSSKIVRNDRLDGVTGSMDQDRFELVTKVFEPRANGSFVAAGSKSPRVANSGIPDPSPAIADRLVDAEKRLTAASSPKHYSKLISSSGVPKKVDPSRPMFEQLDDPRAVARRLADIVARGEKEATRGSRRMTPGRRLDGSIRPQKQQQVKNNTAYARVMQYLRQMEPDIALERAATKRDKQLHQEMVNARDAYQEALKAYQTAPGMGGGKRIANRYGNMTERQKQQLHLQRRNELIAAQKELERVKLAMNVRPSSAANPTAKDAAYQALRQELARRNLLPDRANWDVPALTDKASTSKMSVDEEWVDLMLNPQRAKDAAEVAKSQKSFGKHNIAAKTLVGAGVAGLVAGSGVATYGAKKEQERNRNKHSSEALKAHEYHAINWGPDLRQEDLAEIQSTLNFTLALPPDNMLTPDGEWGNKTSHIVRRYQRKRGLTPNGKLSRQTLDALEEDRQAFREALEARD